MVFTIILLFIGNSFSQICGLSLNEISNISSNNSTILFVGGSGPGNYSKIQDAIDAANESDIVLVYRGTFYENLYIDKKIILFGQDKDSTIIDGGRTIQDHNIIKSDKNDDVVFVFSTDSLYISGFSIRNGYVGINLVNSTDNYIIDCNIYSNNIGLRLNQSTRNFMSYCNLFKNLIDGIQMWNSSNNIIENCNIFFNEEGVALEYSIYNTFNFCNISNNNHKNIWLINNSNNNKIINCNINKGYSGLVFEGFSNNNLVYHNNFVNNEGKEVDNAYDECENIWDGGNLTGGNFWDDYAGIDENNDSLGDTPYNISGGKNQDKYPLMSPIINYDIEPPVVKIFKPIKGLYIFSLLIRKYLIRRPLIFGKIRIKANITDNINNHFNLVEFYIDGKLRKIDTTPSYEFIWERDRLRIFGHRHTIKVVAFDQSGNSGFTNIKVWKFL